ncbi:MAG: D-alanyl-D-alanine-carboxypeptidase/endopeptidase AmpH [Chromatiaceae bacterium]|nr:D-alanyl-D-alanine-carboxypeptidase/endopeptidase AmpH [Chromatiaceae bacterium]
MLRSFIVICGLTVALTAPVTAEDRMLTEAVELTGTILFVGHDVPGLVIGVVRNGETAVAGFGKTRADGGEPGGDTMMRIGSITKVFTGLTLAHLVADGTVHLTDPVARHLDWDVAIPEKDGNAIRLVDLATHASGLPREIDAPRGPPDQPEAFHTEEQFTANLKDKPLIFAPGTGIYYSNFAFDVLSSALANAAGKPYDELLSARVLGPIGLSATTFEPTAEQRRDLMQGHGFDGEPWPDTVTSPGIYGSGGLFSTANDMLHWLGWNLDRFGRDGAEARAISQAAHLFRDNLDPVYGMDESGHMDAMGLGWVVMQPHGDRPLILQKAGGMQGVFSYLAFAPTRGVGVFVAINQYDFPLAMAMAETANELIEQLAPR